MPACTQMQWVASNTRAVRLRQSMGFEIVGTVPGAFRHSTEGPHTRTHLLVSIGVALLDVRYRSQGVIGAPYRGSLVRIGEHQPVTLRKQQRDTKRCYHGFGDPVLERAKHRYELRA